MLTRHIGGGLAALFTFLLTGPLAAQSTKAELLGTIRDSSDRIVGGAELRLANPRTGAVAVSASDAGGRFQFLALPPGEYRLSVARDGFAPLAREGILLRVGDRTSLDLTLTVGGGREHARTGPQPLRPHVLCAALGCGDGGPWWRFAIDGCSSGRCR